MDTFSEIKLSGAKKTSWIFGAGASSVNPYNVPTQAKMLQHFLDANFPGRPQRKADIDAIKTNIRKYCRDILPGVDINSDQLTLEEVFSAYEIILSENRSTQEDRENAKEALRLLTEAIKLATYVLGRGDAKKWKPHARMGVVSPYAELIEKIFPSIHHAKTNTFITFNYDICLDRCLINLRDHIDIDLDYGIVLANERTPTAPKFSSPRTDNATLLLRTHGGLNWLRCEACQSVFTTVNNHASVKDAQKCWACGSTQLSLILVHPSFVRNYNDPIIQLVWGRCQEELVLSDRWVFIGYSLPTADVHFRELIRHCLRQRDKSHKDTEILVVQRRQKDGTYLNEHVKGNYVSMFGERISIWEATDNGFADLAQCIK